MKPLNAVIAGSGLMGTALIVGAGDAFLWLWNQASAGETDIMARGPFLLALFLPYFLLASVLLTAVTVGFAGRWSGIRLRSRMFLAMVAVCAGFVLIYVDPAGIVLTARSAILRSDSPLLLFVVDGVAVVAGYNMLQQGHTSPF